MRTLPAGVRLSCGRSTSGRLGLSRKRTVCDREFCQGAYCVALALHFIEEQLADGSSWVPNISMKDQDGNELEADFAMFLRPRRFSEITEPFVVFAECKTFDRFKSKDISRMEQIAKRFPGAVLCFATLNQELPPAG